MTEISFVGGDRRQLFAASHLLKHGYKIKTFALGGDDTETLLSQALCGADAVVLPLPSFAGGCLNAPLHGQRIAMCDVTRLIRAGTVIGGNLPDTFCGQICPDVRTVDMMRRDDFAVLNSVPSAEGAICVLIGVMDITIHSSRMAVIGYGRLGRALGIRLRLLGADVFAFSRGAASRACAVSDGVRAYELSALPEYIGEFDAIINTVPQCVMDAGLIGLISRDTALIELASAPGGFDRAAASACGLTITDAPSLPGRMSPRTAGTIIAETVINIIRQEKT